MPILLTNTIRKLREKLVAEVLQQKTELRHELVFVGRRGNGAITSVRLAQKIPSDQEGARVVGKTIKSAFNGLDRAMAKGLLAHFPKMQKEASTSSATSLCKYTSIERWHTQSQ